MLVQRTSSVSSGGCDHNLWTSFPCPHWNNYFLLLTAQLCEARRLSQTWEPSPTKPEWFCVKRANVPICVSCTIDTGKRGSVSACRSFSLSAQWRKVQNKVHLLEAVCIWVYGVCVYKRNGVHVLRKLWWYHQPGVLLGSLMVTTPAYLDLGSLNALHPTLSDRKHIFLYKPEPFWWERSIYCKLLSAHF